MSGHKKWDNWIMTMRVGDWQSESDMEGIPNSCDVDQNRFLICWNIWLKRKEHYIKYKWRCCKLLQMVVSKSLVVSCGAWGTLLASPTLSVSRPARECSSRFPSIWIERQHQRKNAKVNAVIRKERKKGIPKMALSLHGMIICGRVVYSDPKEIWMCIYKCGRKYIK